MRRSLADYISDQGLMEGMRRVAVMSERNDVLQQLTRELVSLLYGEEGRTAFWQHYTRRKEQIAGLLGEDADCYLAYVYGTGFPHLAALYLERGYPEQVLADTLSDFDLRAANYRALHRRAGIDDYQWLTRHMTATNFRLGRLQFVFDRVFGFETRIYRSKRDSSRITVAEGGLPVNDRGFLCPVEEASFRTELLQEKEHLTANRIDKHGNVLRGLVTLPLQEYECLIRNGDPVIDIHIPAGGKLGIQECVASLRMALAFAARYFPDSGYAGFVCSSWLFSDEVEELLPEESNLVQFSRKFIRCAGGEGEHELIYQWIFGMDKERAQFRSHEAVTTLQKGAKSLLEQGRWFKARCGFLPVDTLI